MKKKTHRKRPGRIPDRTGPRLMEVRLGDERIRGLKTRAVYETTINRLRGIKLRVFPAEIVRRAVDEYLERNPPRPEDAITAAMEQVATVP